MALDTQQQARVVDWLYERGVRTQCPACGAEGKWSPGNVIAAPEVSGVGMRIGDVMPTMVQIVCGNCAYVMLFDGEPLGFSRKDCKASKS